MSAAASYSFNGHRPSHRHVVPRLAGRTSDNAVRTPFALPRTWPDWVLFGATIWFGSYLYLFVFDNTGLKPGVGYVALVGGAGLWLVGRMALLGRSLSINDTWANRFYLWCALYLGYVTFTFAMLAMGYGPAEPLTQAAEFVALTSAMLLLMAEPRRLAIAVGAFALLAVVGTIVNLYDFVIPTFSDIKGRAAGLYGWPTIAGNFIALAMVAGLTAVPQRLRLAFFAFCGVGVLVTFSRESWLLWGIAFVWAAHQGLFGGTGKLRLRTFIGLALGSAIVIFVFSGGLGQVIGDSHLRGYLNANTLARIGISSSVLSGESTSERQYLVVRSLKEGAESPLLGKGFGYTQNWGFPARPHNTFLLMYVEGGIVGLALFMGLLFLMWQGSVGVGRIAVGMFAVMSVFSHNNLEQPAMMLIVAFALAHGAVVRWQAKQAAKPGVAVRAAGGRHLRGPGLPAPLPGRGYAGAGAR